MKLLCVLQDIQRPSTGMGRCKINSLLVHSWTQNKRDTMTENMSKTHTPVPTTFWYVTVSGCAWCSNSRLTCRRCAAPLGDRRAAKASSHHRALPAGYRPTGRRVNDFGRLPTFLIVTFCRRIPLSASFPVSVTQITKATDTLTMTTTSELM